MSLRDLINEGLIEVSQSTPLEIKQKMEIAKADIESAKTSIKGTQRDVEWAHTQAYNAMLQAGYAIMFSMGYRTIKKSGKHHWTVERFVKSQCTKTIPPDALNAFGGGRLGRHEASYDRIGVISKSQAENLLVQAEVFVKAVKKELNL